MTKKKPPAVELSTAEYAKRVGTSAQIVRRWIREGRLGDAVKLNEKGHYRIEPKGADIATGHSEASPPASDAKSKSDGRISVRQFASRRGVSVPAVRAAIDAGRLDGSFIQNTKGHYRILEDQAAELWNPKAASSATATLRAGDALDDRSAADADADRKRYEARLAQHRYRKETGTSIDIEDLHEEAGEAMAIMKEAMMQTGKKLSGKLIRKSSRAVIESVIDAYMMETLEKLSKYRFSPPTFFEVEE